MIHIERGKAPSLFGTALIQREREKASEFFAMAPGQRRRRRYDFYALSHNRVVRDALRKTFKGKCAYCESLIESTSPGQMDSFRPKQRAIGRNGQIDEDHYWWLAYDWFNLNAACLNCNKLKGSRFPIRSSRARPGAESEELRNEGPLLLDPCFNYPEEHLLFSLDGTVASSTEEGRTTIDVLGLNRLDLVELRIAAITAQRELWDRFVADLGAVSSTRGRLQGLPLPGPDEPYLGARRQVLQEWSRDLAESRPGLRSLLSPILSFRTALPAKESVVETLGAYHAHVAAQESFSVEDDSRSQDYYIKSRLIQRIELHNFKAIADLTLELPPAEEGTGACLLLLGENGAGKSSILQAVSLALMGSENRERLSSLATSSFLRHGATEGHVRIYLTGDLAPIELRFRQGLKGFEASPDNPKVLLLGYGSTRLLPRPGMTLLSSSGAAKADNLFSPFEPLNDATAWLSTLHDADFRQVEEGLKKLLLLDEHDRLVQEPGPPPLILIEAFGTQVSLAQLSDGYQSVVALATDIMSTMRLRWPDMESAEGIVLIDEIDAHLHPRWKMQIVERLRQVFPRLQFLMTSHDPLCLRGLRQGEVAVMKRDPEDRVMVVTDLPSPQGLRIDQILTSEFFGLGSTRSPEDDRLFEEYYELLALRAPNPKQAARLAELKLLLQSRDLFGTTRRERLMLEAADRFIAKSDATSDSVERTSFEAEARSEIAALWESTPARGRKA